MNDQPSCLCTVRLRTYIVNASSSSSCHVLRGVQGLGDTQGCLSGFLGSQHPWAVCEGGTSWQSAGLMRGACKSCGSCHRSQFIPQATAYNQPLGSASDQEHRKKGAASVFSGVSRAATRAWHLLGAASAVCMAVCVEGHAGRAAHSASYQAAA